MFLDMCRDQFPRLVPIVIDRIELNLVDHPPLACDSTGESQYSQRSDTSVTTPPTLTTPFSAVTETCSLKM